ncbi:beta-1,3-galactosyltransferase 5-like [Mytilus californianus]|uniref:beta-1,3-galactosyltransferase 5-like n=1 Tax=Mytilus californianus TaxID=6549 RepID=UPI00224573C6|nr:beta-1,3-galactosyltransferase 5-like [Mytilus californianus]XP_052102450.1 beta-1,3-galactosyltransferase 5-like [Mytilus californianus]
MKLRKTIMWNIFFLILLWIFIANYPRNQRKMHTLKMQTKLTNRSAEKRITYNGRNISTEFEQYYKNVSTDKLMDPLIHKHRYCSLLHTTRKCKNKHVFLLVLVYSATCKFEERQVIRKTFGSISKFDNKHIEYVFVLGQTANDTQQMDIEQESVKYKDMIQGNFIDSYRNLTYKRVFSLFWVNKFCNNVTYVLKIDDDITVNIPFLIPYLRDKQNKTSVLECFYLIEAGPYRDRRYKWYLSLSEYPFATFPPYCAGPSSIMSADVIREMYEATTIMPFFWLEDVYGGGFLPWISRIKIVHPKNYIKDLRDSLKDKPCHLFYINNLKNTRHPYVMWSAIEKYTQNFCVNISKKV